MRLNDIADDLAPTIASVIQPSFASQKLSGWGVMSRAAIVAPRNANGSANNVCSILIISSVTCSRLARVITLLTSNPPIGSSFANRLQNVPGSNRPARFTLPHGRLRVLQSEMIHHPVDEVIDQRDQIGRTMVERRHCRDDYRARLSQLEHI